MFLARLRFRLERVRLALAGAWWSAARIAGLAGRGGGRIVRLGIAAVAIGALLTGAARVGGYWDEARFEGDVLGQLGAHMTARQMEQGIRNEAERAGLELDAVAVTFDCDGVPASWVDQAGPTCLVVAEVEYRRRVLGRERTVRVRQTKKVFRDAIPGLPATRPGRPRR